MAEKKYYWLKLQDNFFEDDTIQFIEEQENGIAYSNFYLKLCLKSLRNDGKLIRFIGDTLIPYDVKSLSKLTGVEFDTVKSAMQLFERIGLVKVLETGEIYLSQIDEMIGSETDKAKIMRRKRAEDKLNGNNVTKMLPKCYLEKEIDIRDKSIDINNSKKHKYGEYQHVLLTDDQYSKLKSEYSNADELIKYLDEYIEMKGYKAKNHYLAIKKWVVDAVSKHHRQSNATLPEYSTEKNPKYENADIDALLRFNDEKL